MDYRSSGRLFFTFSSAFGSWHLWHPITSTGASAFSRMTLMFSKVCCQLGGTHFVCLLGDKDSSWSTPSDWIADVERLGSESDLRFSNLTLSRPALVSMDVVGPSFFCFSKFNRSGAGALLAALSTNNGFSSYSILILFLVRLGEKYGEVVLGFEYAPGSI